jgi:hypothetical protein
MRHIAALRVQDGGQDAAVLLLLALAGTPRVMQVMETNSG